MTQLKLIGPTMFRTFRCVWMLEELGLQYQHDTRAKPWSSTAKQYHPQGKIPILVDGELTVYESAAINTYLGDKYGGKSDCNYLVPSASNPKQRGLYNQFLLTIMTEMDAQGLWIHRKHEALQQYFGKSPEAVKEAKRQFDATQEVLMKQLSMNGPYLLGNKFTAVDILYVHCLDWASSIGWFCLHDSDGETRIECEESPSRSKGDQNTLTKYLTLCRSRPAYQRTFVKQKEEQQEEEAHKKAKQEEEQQQQHSKL